MQIKERRSTRNCIASKVTGRNISGSSKTSTYTIPQIDQLRVTAAQDISNSF